MARAEVAALANAGHVQPQRIIDRPLDTQPTDLHRGDFRRESHCQLDQSVLLDRSLGLEADARCRSGRSLELDPPRFDTGNFQRAAGANDRLLSAGRDDDPRRPRQHRAAVGVDLDRQAETIEFIQPARAGYGRRRCSAWLDLEGLKRAQHLFRVAAAIVPPFREDFRLVALLKTDVAARYQGLADGIQQPQLHLVLAGFKAGQLDQPPVLGVREMRQPASADRPAIAARSRTRPRLAAFPAEPVRPGCRRSEKVVLARD